ncbi:hypothetical protein AUJ10_02140 [Candidatus Pacearchaeota archaeon CG1_02_31_27]|nr:MAG: hypothetical protein AUJ10_02140 [Candidatus Pacearchaeota archaeon CG1_02_31_27]PIN92149.1 MAG: hypothetical protein COU55_02135 [Candidatus Pacearchaeota archaeon CG10_big_fil_rev_8_21_14_0_10_31_59]PIZ80781.1 MAG: hypothetical protein COX99_01700 [Candidatus Pacearchaeota archaeon CG_4_10_14_0_2_um_filter_31_10]
MEQNKISPLNRNNEELILDLCENKYGFKPKLQFFKKGEKKIWAFKGKISKDFFIDINKCTKIEIIGFYFGFIDENDLRLSNDACQLFRKEIKKNIFELNDKQAEEWLKGNDLILEEKPDLKEGYIILKNKDELIGCGKLTGSRIWNYVNKERRVR